MAELSDEQKDAISHRGRAARALLAWLRTGRRQSRLMAAAIATARPEPGVACVAAEQQQQRR